MNRKHIFLLLIAVMLLLTACGCDHQWSDANCTSPKTCTVCGDTEGAPLGHIWFAATCDAPQTCQTCGETSGEKLDHQWEGTGCDSKCTLCGAMNNTAGHQWQEATCTEAKACAVCGETEGEAPGHSWEAASCLYPAYCQSCGLEDGEAAGHTWADNSTETLGYCTTCGKAVEFFLRSGTVAAWTEYEIAANGDFVNPITYTENSVIQWFQDGKLQSWSSQEIASTATTHAYYVDGKIYYYDIYAYPVNGEATGDKLAVAANGYVDFMYYYGATGHLILLTDEDFMSPKGEAAAAVDTNGTKYVIVHKTTSPDDPANTWVVKYNW